MTLEVPQVIEDADSRWEQYIEKNGSGLYNVTDKYYYQLGYTQGRMDEKIEE